MNNFWQFLVGASSYVLPILSLAGVVGLYRIGMRLNFLLKHAVVLRLPVAAHQDFLLPGGQRYDFFIERSWLSKDFSKARFWMHDAEGKPVQLTPAILQYEIGTLLATRKLHWTFETPGDGRLTLFMDGVVNPPGRRSCIVIQRPTGMKFMRYLLTLLVFALLAVWGLLGTISLWSGQVLDVVQ